MATMCYSCGIPLEGEFKGASEDYCKFCCNEDGSLKSREEMLEGTAGWFMSWQPNLTQEKARARAAKYMAAMPAWAED